MLVATPDQTISQILNSYILHTTTLPSASNAGGNVHQEKIKHLHYLNDFRTQQCPLFLDHKCQSHRPFACFHWHFPNQKRRRPVKKSDGTFNYNPDVYCTSYDENTGVCPNGDECQYVHRNAGDTERRYHPRYYKTGQCIYETTDAGQCVKNGQHCAFAHGVEDLRQPVYDIREVADAAEHIANLPATLEKERVLSEDPKWIDMLYVLAFYKTQLCKKPPRMCRQGYACPYYHNGKDRRRNPHSFRYRSTPCPQVKPSGDDWKDSNQCEAQDECAYCHTRTEQQFHPEIYKSTKCNDMIHEGYCPRGPFCAFAHCEGEANIGRDFLSTPTLIEDLNKRHGAPSSNGDEVGNNSSSVTICSSKDSRQLEEKSSGSVSVCSNSRTPLCESPSQNTSNLFFNASVTKSQMGIGMLGLSALNSNTINYLQSLISAQTQIIQQYTGSSNSNSNSNNTGPITSSCSNSTISNKQPSPPLGSSSSTKQQQQSQHQQHSNSNMIVGSAPCFPLALRGNSACSSDSGLSTTRDDAPLFHQNIDNIMSPDKDNFQPLDSDDSKYPNMNMILGQVLGDSFNCSSLSEVNSLPERCLGTSSERSNAGRYMMDDSLLIGAGRRTPRMEEEDEQEEEEREDVCMELMGCSTAATSAPLNIPVGGTGRPRGSGAAGNFWASTATSSAQGSPGGSSGFGDSVPQQQQHLSTSMMHSRFVVDQQQTNCRGSLISNTSNHTTVISNSNSSSCNIHNHNHGTGNTSSANNGNACSPASARLPQSPIMIQSPFNNAACDLEKLVMERELSEIKGRLSETQKELSSMRHQRDVVLMQLQESWRLIQSLVSAATSGSSSIGSDNIQCDKTVGNNTNGTNSVAVAAESNKENLQMLSDFTKLSQVGSLNSGHSNGNGKIMITGSSVSLSSSPDQSTSLHSSQSTCTLKE